MIIFKRPRTLADVVHLWPSILCRCTIPCRKLAFNENNWNSTLHLKHAQIGCGWEFTFGNLLRLRNNLNPRWPTMEKNLGYWDILWYYGSVSLRHYYGLRKAWKSLRVIPTVSTLCKSYPLSIKLLSIYINGFVSN